MGWGGESKLSVSVERGPVFGGVEDLFGYSGNFTLGKNVVFCSGFLGSRDAESGFGERGFLKFLWPK